MAPNFQFGSAAQYVMEVRCAQEQIVLELSEARRSSCLYQTVFVRGGAAVELGRKFHALCTPSIPP